MKFLKHKIALLVLVIASSPLFVSCDENESGVELIGFESRFITSTDFNVVSFINVSQEATSYLWTFEDGTTSTLFEPPTREYFENGTYNISLLAKDKNGNSSLFEGRVVINLSCTFETDQSIDASDLNITFADNSAPFIGDNVGFAVIGNPDSSGINTSCKVGEVARFNNSPFDNLQINLNAKLDFTSNEGIKLKVWSPIANTTILLKLEEVGNSGNFVEIPQTITTANTWEELTFNFAPGDSNKFNKMVIFFNFNVSDGSTYYFDDLMLY